MRPLAVARNRGVRDSSARLLALLGRLAGIVPAYLPLDFASYHIYPPVSTPAGGRAFVERETFLVAQGSCGQGLGPCGNGRMPAVVGEFGASVTPAHGDAFNQAAFLTMVAERSHACGYQGVQWWQYADVHWGDPVQDHFGLFSPGGERPDALAMRPAGMALKELHLLKPHAACERPPEWGQPLFGAGVSGSKFHYRGNVHDERLKGVPYAVLTGRLSGGGSVYFTVLADSKGNYDFHAPSSRR